MDTFEVKCTDCGKPVGNDETCKKFAICPDCVNKLYKATVKERLSKLKVDMREANNG